MKATAKDVRFKTKKLIDTVSRGEEVIITYRGKPCAKLVPYQQEQNVREPDDLFGMWKDYKATKDVGEYVRKLRQKRF
jgi:prevent-host-death family protein